MTQLCEEKKKSSWFPFDFDFDDNGGATQAHKLDRIGVGEIPPLLLHCFVVANAHFSMKREVVRYRSRK